MKKIKALWWTTFGVINVYGIFLLTIYIIFMKTSGDPLNLILYQIFLSVSGVLLVVIAVLAILNVKACLKYREELMWEPPEKINLVMKFALIRFFVMNFLFFGWLSVYMPSFSGLGGPRGWSISSLILWRRSFFLRKVFRPSWLRY